MDKIKLNTSYRITDAQRIALREVLSGLSTIFWGPTSDVCQQMLDGVFVRPFEKLAPTITSDPPDALEKLGDLFHDFTDAETFLDVLEENYVSLFINDREGIPAPLYASCYEGEDPRLMGESALQMQGRFISKGLAQDKNIGEPPDHLSIELEFLYFLLSQENADNDPDPLIEAASFAYEAMLPWVRSFHERLWAAAPFRFYPLVSAILVAVLDMISGLAGIED